MSVECRFTWKLANSDEFILLITISAGTTSGSTDDEVYMG
jgi:hypothetical protein